MKKLLLLALAACLPFSMAMAVPDPVNFHIVYGNVDGSALSVGLDKDIEVPVWGATAPAGVDPADSVSFVHMPLMSNNLYITTRGGGFFPAFGVGLWDDKSFLTVDNNGTDPLVPVGFQSQSILGFAYLTDPRDPQNFIYTEGAYQLLGTYRMHTANDPGYINGYFDAFSQGHNGPNGGLLWGMSDGINGVVPMQVYCQLFFSPNAAPVYTGPTAVTTGQGVVINLTGTDSDLLDILGITQVAGNHAGTLTIIENTNGVMDAVWTGVEKVLLSLIHI